MTPPMAPLTQVQQHRVDAVASAELADRVRTGGYFYPAAGFIMAGFSSYGSDYGFAWLMVATMAVLSVFRWRAAKRLSKGGAADLPRLRLYAVALVVCWTVFAMVPLVVYGLEFPGLLALVCGLGLSAGTHIAFLIDRPLHVAHVSTLGSGVAAGVLISNPASVALPILGLIVLYIGFLVAQGRKQHATYWEGLANAERLRDALVSAEAASRAKSEFVANMSHELRTPISGILGMTGVMMEETLTETVHDRLHLVNNSAAGLLSVVDDILNFSKIEAGRLSVQVEAFRLRKLLAETVRLLAWPVRQHSPPRIDVLVEVEPDVPNALYGDAGKLRQILTNLVGNAFKFTDAGIVGVYVRRLREDSGRVWLEFAVRDTGVGIPISRQKEIFDSFTQVDGSPSRRFGGTGLGLTISSSLVSVLEGSIRVESEPGAGSTFVLEVPFPFAAKAGGHPMPSEEGKKRLAARQIWVVDSSERVQFSLKRTLEQWTSNVQYVSTLSDLPELSDHAVVIADEHVFDPNDEPRLTVPLVVLSTPPGRRSSGVGRATLPKPVHAGELLEALLHVLDVPEQAQTAQDGTQQSNSHGSEPSLILPPAPTVPSPPKGIRVLLVEDNPINRIVAVHIMASLGCEVKAVASGQEALAAVDENDYDIIFMDVAMPDMDGFEVTRRIRETHAVAPGAASVTIVALTAHAMEGDAQRCRDAGMDGYLSKPVDRRVVARTLMSLDLDRDLAAPAEGDSVPANNADSALELQDLTGSALSEESSVASIVATPPRDNEEQRNKSGSSETDGSEQTAASPESLVG